MKKLIITLLSFCFVISAYGQTHQKKGTSSKTHSSGTYKRGSGSSHKGGSYKNSSTNNHYKKRK